jgi:glutamine amidotransferase-like uncharacterized protein
MTVYIYHGHGASLKDAAILKFMFSMTLHPHGIPVKCFTETDLNASSARWQKDGDLIVFGGGEFTKVKERLSTYGRQAIIDFAGRKSYLGICKGGYAGAAQIRFFGQDGAKTSDGFGFFNGVARGSLPIAPSLYTGKSDSAQIARFRHEKYGIEFPALYWGGPCFDMAENSLQHVQKLVTLQFCLSDKPVTMGIKVPVGEAGQAVLLGYHAEATPPHIREWVLQFSDNTADISRILRDMDAYESWKFYLGFACMMDDLELVKDYSFLEQILYPQQTGKARGFDFSRPACKIA